MKVQQIETSIWCHDASFRIHTKPLQKVMVISIAKVIEVCITSHCFYKQNSINLLNLHIKHDCFLYLFSCFSWNIVGFDWLIDSSIIHPFILIKLFFTLSSLMTWVEWNRILITYSQVSHLVYLWKWQTGHTETHRMICSHPVKYTHCT